MKRLSVTGEYGPFYVDDLESLRHKLISAEKNNTVMGKIWSSVKRRAQASPEGFPWFTPFVALITTNSNDIENAKNAVRRYVSTLYPQSFGEGTHFHFWCYALPHARWSLYFHWLSCLGAWDKEEEQDLLEKFIVHQYIYFFSGMHTKPDPECVDNQTMSLCYSNALMGYLFGYKHFGSAMAKNIYKDAVGRLPQMLGGIAESGYTGEGSTYMDVVLGSCVPLLVEFLERTQGGDWFSRKLEPRKGSAEAVVRMIAREWMPGGLLLPWDHYGYTIPTRQSIAYAARRTQEKFYMELLEKHADWSYSVGTGWGYDDLVWTLIWWPESCSNSQGTVFSSWAEKEIGAALLSEDGRYYLMQMWDAAEVAPTPPGRMHVNPNSMILSAYGSLLTVDGICKKDCTRLQFEDAWEEVNSASIQTIRQNFGVGCAGAHSVLLIDGWEGLRPFKHYTQADLVKFDVDEKEVIADVTPLYRERYTDTRLVRRRSRLYCERFWIIEDLALFEQEHDITARWFLRPENLDIGRGIAIETAEGVRLYLMPLVGENRCSVETIEGYPVQLEGRSIMADFTRTGREFRELWLAWPENTRMEKEDITEGWKAIADPMEIYDYSAAHALLQSTVLRLPLTMPAYLLADQPLVRRWWYNRKVPVPEAECWWLQLPRNMINLRVWVDGKQLDITRYKGVMNLLYPQVELPHTSLKDTVEVVVCCDTGISQYGVGSQGGTGFYGKASVLVPVKIHPPSAVYEKGVVKVKAGEEEWSIPYTMMEGEEG